MDILPVSVPGREARFGEALSDSIDSLADRLALELEAHPARPYAFFGYSMGALLGYEIGRRWGRWGLRAPEMFFILGCNAPDRMMLDREPFHSMNDADFRQVLMDLGGIHPEILDNAEAMALFEPGLRNDFRLCETYEHSIEGGRLDCPAHVFVGKDDDYVRPEPAAEWSQFLTGKVQVHMLEGRHMLDAQALAALPARIEKLWLGDDSAAVSGNRWAAAH